MRGHRSLSRSCTLGQRISILAVMIQSPPKVEDSSLQVSSDQTSAGGNHVWAHRRGPVAGEGEECLWSCLELACITLVDSLFSVFPHIGRATLSWEWEVSRRWGKAGPELWGAAGEYQQGCSERGGFIRGHRSRVTVQSCCRQPWHTDVPHACPEKQWI